jgi:hypothetical protein
MRSTFEPCIPTSGKAVPAGKDWFHEIKYDGFRLIVHRDGDRVRLLTRNGHDWSQCYPWIVESALKNRSRQFVIDGEAVVLGVDGVSDFDALYSRQHDEEVQLYAFDILALDGDDLQALPLSMRKKPEAAASPAFFWMARTGATSCRVVSIHPQCELKRSTEGYVWSDPQPATVVFDDRTAD